jgi:peptide/nickel transport system substrate-binding protein
MSERYGPMGALSRRRFNAGLIGAGAAAALIPGSGTLAQATPKKGGRIRIAVTTGGPNDTLDPLRMTTPADAVRGFQVYNCLVETSTKLTPEPELAESWEARPGALEWHFKLRRGVQFHNGKTLDADDVAYSINRIIAPDSKSAAKALLSSIKEVKADGKEAVTFVLNAPNADLPLLMTGYHLGIVPNGHTDFDNPVGTGGFKVKQFKPGAGCVTTRNANYWKPGKANVDEVETFLLGDATARISALLSGDVQIIQDIDYKSVDLVQRNPAVQIVSSRSGTHLVLVMMADRAPTDDANVRLAMKYAIDRQQVLQTVLRGHGVLGNDHPIAPFDPYYNADLPIRAYDPEKSKFYLKKAGHDRLSVALHTGPYNIGGHDAALLYKEMARAGGLDIDIKLEPTDGYFSNIWMKRPFHVSAWRPRPTTDQVLTIAYSSGASWNETAWKREAFDKILVEARGTLDQAKRKQLYGELQKMIHEDGGAIIPAFSDQVDGAAKNIQGFEPHPAGALSAFRVAEKVWIG